MKNDIFSNALELLAKSNASKNSLAYKSAKQLLENPTHSVSTGKAFGTGRYRSSKSWGLEVVRLLASVGVESQVFNTAPRGGKSGEVVALGSQVSGL